MQAAIHVFLALAGGQDDDVGVGVELAQLFDGVGAQVHDDDVGAVLTVQRQRFRAGGRLGHALEVRRG